MRFFVFKMKVLAVGLGLLMLFLFSYIAVTAWNEDSQPAHEYTYADCKARLESDMDKALTDKDWKGNKTRPKECENVTDEQAKKLVDIILNERLDHLSDQ